MARLRGCESALLLRDLLLSTVPRFPADLPCLPVPSGLFDLVFHEALGEGRLVAPLSSGGSWQTMSRFRG